MCFTLYTEDIFKYLGSHLKTHKVVFKTFLKPCVWKQMCTLHLKLTGIESILNIHCKILKQSFQLEVDIFWPTNEVKWLVTSDETGALTDEAEDFDALLEEKLASSLLCMQTILHASTNAIQHIMDNFNELLILSEYTHTRITIIVQLWNYFCRTVLQRMWFVFMQTGNILAHRRCQPLSLRNNASSEDPPGMLTMWACLLRSLI